MKRFVEGEDRNQVTLLPESFDDHIGEDNPVRVIDVFINELDLSGLGCEGMAPAVTGRPAYHAAVLLKINVAAKRSNILKRAAAPARQNCQTAHRQLQLMASTSTSKHRSTF